MKDDEDRRGRAFRRQRRRDSGARCNHVDLAADEVGGQCGQPIVPILCPAVFDRHILSFDIAGFAQALAERGYIWRIRAGRGAAQKADHRHRLLLRAGDERPGGSAAQKGDEMPSLHEVLASLVRGKP